MTFDQLVQATALEIKVNADRVRVLAPAHDVTVLVRDPRADNDTYRRVETVVIHGNLEAPYHNGNGTVAFEVFFNDGTSMTTSRIPGFWMAARGAMV